ncbi:MAG: hypothetical protein JWL59_1034 [Chthoniobacteraceae bacterium]|nr:hypothetical protein [Chthoniobacteraceae bacterium]
MPQFRFVARNSEGKLIDGVITCNDRAAAIHHVEKDRCVPIKIEPVKEKAAAASTKLYSNGSNSSAKTANSEEKVDTLSHSQLYLFTEQLAHLLSAGMTLDEALGILVKRLKHPRLAALCKTLHQALIEGRSLSQAMREFPRIFSPLYYNMVSAGEASGALGDILKRLVKHLSALKALRDKVTQALVYPALLVGMGIILIIVFIKFMVPQMMSFLSKTGGRALPLPTQILMKSNELLTQYWWLGLLLGFGAYTGFKAFTRSPEGRKSWDTFIWKMPLFSSILRYRYYAQFARTLGTLIENGVTLLKALELLEDISGNEYVRARMSLVRKAVVDGATMSVALGEQKIFPELFADMMAVGEQSGKFDQTMQMIADVYERELDKQVQITSELIPPLVMLAIAAVVGLIVFGVLSAVFALTQDMHA